MLIHSFQRSYQRQRNSECEHSHGDFGRKRTPPVDRIRHLFRFVRDNSAIPGHDCEARVMDRGVMLLVRQQRLHFLVTLGSHACKLGHELWAACQDGDNACNGPWVSRTDLYRQIDNGEQNRNADKEHEQASHQAERHIPDVKTSLF